MGQALPPFEDGPEIEIRQVFEAEDFGAEFTPELREQEERLRAQMAKSSSRKCCTGGGRCSDR